MNFIGLFLSSLLKMHGPKNKIEFTSFPPNNKKEVIKFALRIAINAYASKIIKP